MCCSRNEENAGKRDRTYHTLTKTWSMSVARRLVAGQQPKVCQGLSIGLELAIDHPTPQGEFCKL